MEWLHEAALKPISHPGLLQKSRSAEQDPFQMQPESSRHPAEQLSLASRFIARFPPNYSIRKHRAPVQVGPGRPRRGTKPRQPVGETTRRERARLHRFFSQASKKDFPPLRPTKHHRSITATYRHGLPHRPLLPAASHSRLHAAASLGTGRERRAQIRHAVTPTSATSQDIPAHWAP